MIKDENGHGENEWEDPGDDHQQLGPSPRAGEVHRVGDGVVAVDAEGNQDIGRGVGHHALAEPDQLARVLTGVPRYRYPPYYVYIAFLINELIVIN